MMGTFEAIDIIEGFDDGDPIEAFQALINSGTVWKLQGSYGRAAKELIEQGLCHLPERG